MFHIRPIIVSKLNYFIFCLFGFIFQTIYLFCSQMIKERGQWTAQQDAIITMLYQQRHMEDWSEIARVASDQYNFPKKNSKQIKERYMNHLNPTIFKIEWSHEEQLLFMKLHNQIGNKWASIAHHLSGKTDNCVKNHFYSKLRKLLRKLNKIIQFFLKKQFRPIDISIMYKIVQAAEQRFKQKPNCQESVSLQCLHVQNKMLQFAMFKDTNEGEQEEEIKYTASHIDEYKELIKDIYRVSKLYKRKSKKVRNSLIQAPVNSSRKKTKKDQIKVQKNQQQSEQEQQEREYQPKQKVANTILVRKRISQKSQSWQAQQIKKEENNRILNEEQVDKDEKKQQMPQTSGRIQVQEGEGIQQLLRTAGILHDEIKPNNIMRNQKHLRKYSSSQYSVSSSVQNVNQGQQQSFLGNLSAQYSPLNSFSSQQMQNFLGFPMTSNGTSNNYANFTLSQKSSFKSYSQRDPSQIDNPFFDEYSSNNARLMFPMNFSMPVNNQYQQVYNQNTENDGDLGSRGGGYPVYQYSNVYYQPKQDNQEENFNGKKTRD